jgi:Cupin domain
MESQIDDGPPLHVHDHEDESFYVLEGTVRVRCGGDVFEAGPRSFVFWLWRELRDGQAQARCLAVRHASARPV